jgi:hypothetical protein
MPWNNARLLVVSGGISCKLENFGSKVFDDSGEVNGGAGTNSLGIIAFTKKTVDSTNRKLKTRPA